MMMDTAADTQVFPGPNLDLMRDRESKSTMEDAFRRRSIGTVLGSEGKFVDKGIYSDKAIGVFTSGGDAQGK